MNTQPNNIFVGTFDTIDYDGMKTADDLFKSELPVCFGWWLSMRTFEINWLDASSLRSFYMGSMLLGRPPNSMEKCERRLYRMPLVSTVAGVCVCVCVSVPCVCVARASQTFMSSWMLNVRICEYNIHTQRSKTDVRVCVSCAHVLPWYSEAHTATSAHGRGWEHASTRSNTNVLSLCVIFGNGFEMVRVWVFFVLCDSFLAWLSHNWLLWLWQETSAATEFVWVECGVGLPHRWVIRLALS